MKRAFAFGFGFAAGLTLIPLAIVEFINWKLSDQPLCDGDFENEETIEGDGFITCHFSGPIRPIN